MPVIVWGAVLPDITERGFKEIHRVNGTMDIQNQVAAKFMLEHGYRRWSVIHDTTDYGKGHDKFFTRYAKQGGGQILTDAGVTADQQDFTAELTQVKVGRGLMSAPRLLLVDEPSLGLSPLFVKENFAVIERINQQGITVFLVEQNVHQTLAIAHHGYVLSKGRVVTAGTREELLADEQVHRAYFGGAEAKR